MIDAGTMDGEAATGRDDRKSARLSAQHAGAPAGPPGSVVSGYPLARAILRSATMRQAALADNAFAATEDPEQAPVFFLDGEPHRRKRTDIARFFTPVAVATRYRALMERETDRLLAALHASGGGELDAVSFELAVAVAGDIVGLTGSDVPAMARRIHRTFTVSTGTATRPLRRWWNQAWQAVHVLHFFLRDVRPAIAARRRQRQEDVISHLIDKGYPSQAILIECMTYAFAGMVTTREFIVMAAWHLFEQDALRARFLASDEAGQLAILEEILRLEPVASLLFRKASEPVTLAGAAIEPGVTMTVDVRAANTDPAVVGRCPFAIDPDRAAGEGRAAPHLSFGDGAHKCPGASVALHESRVFLDRLLRVPGIRLAAAPHMSWNTDLTSYELRQARVVCDAPA